MDQTVALTFILLAYTGVVFGATDWGYEGDDGPSHWKDNYPICKENRQSPIDLKGKTYNSGLAGGFTLSNWGTTTGTLKNNGHSAVVELTNRAMTSGGGLPTQYWLAQFHFHWGSSSAKGSEHEIEGKQYPAELHFVHVKNAYGTVGDALNDGEGLAVIGVMIEEGGSDNPDFQSIINGLSSIKTSGASTSVSVNLGKLLPSDTSSFYRYFGSLTTPTCNEAVVWTVLSKTVKISTNQMKAFRAMKDSHNHDLVNNYRPIQSLNGRTVEVSAQSLVYSSGSKVASGILCMLSALLLCIFV